MLSPTDKGGFSMKVSEIMSARPVTVGQNEPAAHAARLMKRHNLGALPVTDDAGRLRGIVTDRDITLRCAAADVDPRSVPVRDIMSRGVMTVSPAEEVEAAARRMGDGRVHRLPVVEAGRIVGMVSLSDMARTCSMEAADALADISSNLRRSRVEKKN
jgi:CBS domain-containing protein